MSKCLICGNELSSDNKVCSKCGNSVNSNRISVKKIYTYSREIALKNSAKPNFLVILFLIVTCISIPVFLFNYVIYLHSIIDFILMFIFLIELIVLYFYCMKNYYIRSYNSLCSLVITNDNRIYKISISVSKHNYQYLKRYVEDEKDLGIGAIIGTRDSCIALVNKYISKIENIEKILNNLSYYPNAFVVEVLNVHSILEKKNKYIVWCDCKASGIYGYVNNNEIGYNKKISFYKSYNNYEEFLNILKNKKI